MLDIINESGYFTIHWRNSWPTLAFFWQKKSCSGPYFFTSIPFMPWSNPPLPVRMTLTASGPEVPQNKHLLTGQKGNGNEKIKPMGLENLLHFESIQSERNCGRFMFQLEVALILYKMGSKLLPRPIKRNLGTSQPRFPPSFCHSLVQSSISPHVVGRIAKNTY